MEMKKSLGIYIHIPFCVQKCRYCDFCSFAGDGGEVRSAYATELIRRIKEYGDSAREYEVDTVYFGGGTPSLMSARDISRILNCVYHTFSVSGASEITLECNPATADRAYFDALRGMGVNRISMGLQSASDRELSLLGRIHTVKDFENTFMDARAAGFDNISADLMYGIPDQDRESLLTSMRYLCDLSPEHISAYGLMLEEGTYLERHRDSFHMADDDTQYEMYLDCTEYLRSRGYHKYEISNFSRDGRHSRHNMRYWRGEEYIGFGVSAHSYFGGFRFGNSQDMDGFMRGWDICEEREYINGEGRREEYIMLGLRLADGISAEEYRCRFGRELYDDLPTLETRIEQGFLQRRDGSISFTDKGFFVSNAILSELLTSDR